jgi:hypothetical protein
MKSEEMRSPAPGGSARGPKELFSVGGPECNTCPLALRSGQGKSPAKPVKRGLTGDYLKNKNLQQIL